VIAHAFSGGSRVPAPSLADVLLAAEFDPSDRPFFARVHARLRAAQARKGPRASLVDACVERLIAKESLAPAEAGALLAEMIGSEVADDQIGALLVAIEPDLLSAEVLAAFARVMREHAPRVSPRLAAGEVLADTCGTGSDTLGTFNVSTTIMFILGAAGIKIAKHGNVAVTSRCGSADVLRALGVHIELDAPAVEACINDVGVGFMFAPLFHTAFRNVQRIRRLLADEMPGNVRARTVFNILGPLVNPAAVHAQILGVYSPALLEKFAHALQLLGINRALVAFGEIDGSTAGLDEFSTAGRTLVAELHQSGAVSTWELAPEAVGLPRTPDPRAYKGGDAKANAQILLDILTGREQGARMDLALLNAGAGLYVGGKAASVAEGVTMARGLVQSGAPLRTFERLRARTRELRS
jgi:anthranilate phosphoribosyltransferase